MDRWIDLGLEESVGGADIVDDRDWLWSVTSSTSKTSPPKPFNLKNSWNSWVFAPCRTCFHHPLGPISLSHPHSGRWQAQDSRNSVQPLPILSFRRGHWQTGTNTRRYMGNWIRRRNRPYFWSGDVQALTLNEHFEESRVYSWSLAFKYHGLIGTRESTWR